MKLIDLLIEDILSQNLEKELQVSTVKEFRKELKYRMKVLNFDFFLTDRYLDGLLWKKYFPSKVVKEFTKNLKKQLY